MNRSSFERLRVTRDRDKWLTLLQQPSFIKELLPFGFLLLSVLLHISNEGYHRTVTCTHCSIRCKNSSSPNSIRVSILANGPRAVPGHLREQWGSLFLSASRSTGVPSWSTRPPVWSRRQNCCLRTGNTRQEHFVHTIIQESRRIYMKKAQAIIQ